MDATPLPERAVAFAVSQIETLERSHLPGLSLPRLFAGHPVGADVRADLLYTLAHLHDAGVPSLRDMPLPELLTRLLHGVDGAATHTFFSYRVAETLRRFGPFEGNPLLEGLTAAEREEVARACDSTAFGPLFRERRLPRNYAAVLARCEIARTSLGLPHDEALLAECLEATRALLEEAPEGLVDDSQTGIGRHDLYAADLVLFAEPFAERLGPAFPRSLRAALHLARATAMRTGEVVPWGRSSGVLAVCLALELAAVALARGEGDAPELAGLAARALDALPDWFEGGLVTAHRHRSPYGYRGLHRWLQMTLDVLGKVAFAGARLAEAGAERLAGTPDRPAIPTRDALLPFAPEPPAGVWSYRTRELAFTWPVVGPTRSDYLPGPRNPTLFEVPVDSELAAFTPVAFRHGVAYVGGGLPEELDKGSGWLRARYRSLPRAGLLEAHPDFAPLRAEREVEVRAEGRSLRIRERLRFEEAPRALGFAVPEARGRPLRVRCRSASPHRLSTLNTDGIADFRSFWGPLPRLHQIDLEPARELDFEVEITPLLRVASTEHGHHYHRSLYDPLADRVADRPFPREAVADPERASELLAHTDFFHLHWPEWIAGPDEAVHRRFVDALRRHRVRLVWTQHNARPHRKDDRYRPIYALYAGAADAVIHHSRWGEARMRAELPYGPRTLHRVIPHGHFGHLLGVAEPGDREAVERELGLAPCAIRIGVVGAPREEKRTAMLMEVFARCPRGDLGLLVFSLAPGEKPPDDPRIRALPYEFVPREVYARRLTAIDLLALPIEGGDYLTTGLVADALGRGLPALCSDWPFLREVLGDAALVYGRGPEDLARALASLDPAEVERARRAALARRDAYAWPVLAERTFELIAALGTEKV